MRTGRQCRGLGWDHPRVGGEKMLKTSPHLYCEGSPPRGRGKVVVSSMVTAPSRITPAWAGKSGSSAAVRSGAWAHPRVGGEKGARRGPALGRTGSPPRGRGKAVKFRCTCGLQRITPAWAGKSRSAGLWAARHRDHPRMGGEKFCRVRLCPMCQGSPPRGRGKVVVSWNLCLLPRITPTHAGKRLS